MYNTSLEQFLLLFYWSISNSAKAQLVKDRVQNIILALTKKVYRYINRGLFERDKTTFKLLMTFKILIKAGSLTNADVGVFLKAGSGIDDRNKKYNWMDQKVWLNIVALSKHKFGNDHSFFYKELPERIGRLEKDWRKFLDENEPENAIIPDFEDKIAADQNIGNFLHLCLIRSVREDRTVLACNQFIKKTLGDYFTMPVTDQIADIWEESLPNRPVLFLLSAGADPTNTIDEFAKKKKQFPTNKVSMGEEQEKPAEHAIVNAGFRDGKWLVLNNCHLSIEFMGQMESVLNPKGVVVNEDFRLWITCQESKEFPLGLLQMAIKVTTEPPQGLQAGVNRTYSTTINQDFLEKVEPYEKWRAMVFTLCFMHSIVWERRKFGPLGFCIGYEFNTSDLEASLLYMEKHLTSCMATGSVLSFKAMQYMTCDIQYGGRITDDLDRETFITYGQFWITDEIFKEKYCFNNLITEYLYHIPDFNEHTRYLEHIQTLPEKDNPLIFGLNGNADLTYRLKQSGEMIVVLVDTMPKDSGGGSGKSLEEEVKEKLQNELIKLLPPDFVEVEVNEKLKVLKGPKSLSDTGMNVPLNVFLFQEIQRLQLVLGIVRTTMTDMVLAIDGQIIMTPALVDCINSIADFRVPRQWQYDPTGVEISWMTPSLAGWLKGLIDRHHQLNGWLTSQTRERPPSFWLTGFFNAQGFLTSMKQEVTRQHRNEQWSLDEVDYKTDVLKEIIPGDDGRIEGKVIKPVDEGVLIHGLYLEGSQWHKNDKRFEEQTSKDLFFPFPIMHVSAESTNKDLMDKAASKKA
jgi:dynein heavy chain